MTRTLRCLALAAAIVAVPAVPAVAGGGGGCHEPNPTEGSGDTVEMTRFCMSPSTLRVEPGTTVTWKNLDPVPHNVYGSAFFGGDLAPGASVAHTFADPGTYAYACTLHPGMVGAVVVGEAPVPIAAVGPQAGDDDAGSAPLVLGLAGIALAVVAFAAGARVRRSAA